MYSILASNINKTDIAYDMFIKSASIDLGTNQKMFAGGIYIGGTHPAAQGGSWMMVVYGFCGFSSKFQKIEVKPNLPPTWKKIVFTAKVGKEKFKVNVTKDGYELCKK
jgi:trehalose/maltose hydrolase-like predicted phosphorylase